MMTEPTPEQLAMARRIARETFPPPDEAIRRDGAYRGALAAIIETTELIAALIERDVPFENDGKVVGRCSGDMITAEAIRAGDHLKGQDHG